MKKSSMPSVVNHVSLINDEQGVRVLKEYGGVSKNLKIPLSKKRSLIEFRVINFLATSFLSEFIKIPRALKYSCSSLELEYINGDLLWDVDDFSSPCFDDLFYSLGVALGGIQNLIYKNREILFREAWDAEGQSAQVMNSLKTPDIPIYFKRKIGSLGDVGLKNIIWDGRFFWLIDFEFCHLNFPGRDVGQLCAQLVAFKQSESMRLCDLLISGYSAAGAVAADVSFWRDNFGKYYGAIEKS